MIIYKRKNKLGRGLLNKVINKLPFELHLPGYQYCGPGKKSAKCLACGDPGINPLEHDSAYSKNRENIETRNLADKVLTDRAWTRVHASEAGCSEKQQLRLYLTP